MGSHERRNLLKQFLNKFNENPISFKLENKPMEKFVLTYFGLSFVEGYRIIEKIGDNIFLLSSMSCDHKSTPNGTIFPSFRTISINFMEKDLNENAEMRALQFSKLKKIDQFFVKQDKSDNIEFHFIFANSGGYSIIDRQLLSKGASLNINKFFSKDYGINTESGRRVPDQRMQGTKLHQLVELFLKGGASFRNQTYVNREVMYQFRLSYSPPKILNTICLIIAKQILEGGFISMTSEKWMRKSTVKKFKRFDLLLRNQEKVCIVDWKFSKINADQKINAAMFAKKNRQYFQLARKEYNAKVQLKFYCFHQRCDGNFHKFTCANYIYELQNIQLSQEDGEKIEKDNSSVVSVEEKFLQITKRQLPNKIIHLPQKQIQSITPNNFSIRIPQQYRNQSHSQKQDCFMMPFHQQEKQNQIKNITILNKKQHWYREDNSVLQRATIFQQNESLNELLANEYQQEKNEINSKEMMMNERVNFEREISDKSVPLRKEDNYEHKFQGNKQFEMHQRGSLFPKKKIQLMTKEGCGEEKLNQKERIFKDEQNINFEEKIINQEGILTDYKAKKRQTEVIERRIKKKERRIWNQQKMKKNSIYVIEIFDSDSNEMRKKPISID